MKFTQIMSDIYYENLSKNREYALFALNECSARSGLANGRKFNRLSTKQIVAKLRRIHKINTKSANNYVSFFNKVVA